MSSLPECQTDTKLHQESAADYICSPLTSLSTLDCTVVQYVVMIIMFRSTLVKYNVHDVLQGKSHILKVRTHEHQWDHCDNVTTVTM